MRREPTVKGGVTIEFVVHEIAGGYLYPAHALGGFHHGWDSSRFTVVERAKR